MINHAQLKRLSLYGGPLTTGTGDAAELQSLLGKSVVESCAILNNGFVSSDEFQSESNYLSRAVKYRLEDETTDPSVLKFKAGVTNAHNGTFRLANSSGSAASIKMGYYPSLENPFFGPKSNDDWEELYTRVHDMNQFVVVHLKDKGVPLIVNKRSGVLEIDHESFLDNVKKGGSDKSKVIRLVEKNFDDISVGHNWLDNSLKFSLQLRTEPQAMIQPFKGKTHTDVSSLKHMISLLDRYVSRLVTKGHFRSLANELRKVKKIQLGTNGGYPYFTSIVRDPEETEIKFHMAVRAKNTFKDMNLLTTSENFMSQWFERMSSLGATCDPILAEYPGALLVVWRTRTAGKPFYDTAYVNNSRKVIGARDDINKMRAAYGVSMYDNSFLGLIIYYLEAIKFSVPGRLQNTEVFGSQLSKIGARGDNLFFMNSDISAFDLNWPVNVNEGINYVITKHLKHPAAFNGFLNSLRRRPMVFQNPDNFEPNTRTPLVIDFGSTMMPSGSFETPIQNFWGTFLPVLDYYNEKGISPEELCDKHSVQWLNNEIPNEFESGDDMSFISDNVEELMDRSVFMRDSFAKLGLSSSPCVTDNYLKRTLRNGNWRSNTFRSYIQNVFGPENPPQTYGVANLGLIAKFERAGLSTACDVFSGGAPKKFKVSSFDRELTQQAQNLALDMLQRSYIPTDLGIKYLKETMSDKPNAARLNLMKSEAEKEVLKEMGMLKAVENLSPETLSSWLKNNRLKKMMFELERDRYSASGAAMYEAIRSAGLKSVIDYYDNAKSALALAINEQIGLNESWGDLI